jgi:ribosomal-protein-alanine N-acetyltransferase
MNLLETMRLIIKPSSLANIDNVYTLFFDSDVMHYIGHGIKTRDETQENLTRMIVQQEKYGFSFGDVYEKKSGYFVGRAGLMFSDKNDDQSDIEVGYALHKQFWQQGYATELTKALIAWAFAHLAINKLIAVVHPENLASRRVLEKAGMRYVEGKDKGPDAIIYQIDKLVK